MFAENKVSHFSYLAKKVSRKLELTGHIFARVMVPEYSEVFPPQFFYVYVIPQDVHSFTTESRDCGLSALAQRAGVVYTTL